MNWMKICICALRLRIWVIISEFIKTWNIRSFCPGFVLSRATVWMQVISYSFIFFHIRSTVSVHHFHTISNPRSTYTVSANVYPTKCNLWISVIIIKNTEQSFNIQLSYFQSSNAIKVFWVFGKLKDNRKRQAKLSHWIEFNWKTTKGYSQMNRFSPL